MAKLPRYGRPDGDAERRDYAAIVAQAFAGDAELFEGWVRGFGDGVRVLRQESAQAGLVVYDMGQYFGGVSVPMWGIAGVAVRPESRSKGLGAELMLATLRDNYENGPPISSLYPAAPRLYRNCGWEYAGARCMYGANLSELPVAKTGLELRTATPADQALLEELYRRRYAHENGCLDRNELIWERVRRVPKDTPLYTYIAENNGVAEGYVSYIQKRSSAGSPRYDLQVHDLVCVTYAAASAILALFARHSSVANRVRFFAAPDDPLVFETARSAELALEQRQHWMLRIVRVKDALEARGYSRYVKASAVVRVVDAALPENATDWTLELTEGQMAVTRGGEGGAVLDVRGIAGLYSGSLSPAQLRTGGLLAGPDTHDAALSAMFAGTAPWMPDYF